MEYHVEQKRMETSSTVKLSF